MVTPHYVVRKIGDQYVTERSPETNPNRPLYLFGGAGLVVYGILRGGMRGAAAAVAGGSMLYYVATGKNPWCRVTAALSKDHIPTGCPSDAPSYQHDASGAKSNQLPANEVDEQVMESFPASDPPASSVHSD